MKRASRLQLLLAWAGGAVVALAPLFAAAASCKGAGDGDNAPAWVAGAAADESAVVSAVGSAPIDGDQLTQALAAARTQALKELAERIRVSVTSSVKLNDSKVSEGGKQVLRSSVESAAEASTQVTLQNVRADQQWVDGRHCVAWVRMAVSRADFDRAARRDLLLGLGKQLNGLLTSAEDASRPLLQRESATAAAAALLGGNDFNEVPEVPLAALKMRLGGVSKMLDKLRQDEKRLLALAQAHVQEYAEFKASTNPVQKLEAAGRALKPLRSLLAAPWVPDETAIGFVPQARLVSLLADAGYPCQARKALDEKGERPAGLPDGLVQKLGGPMCSPADLAQERQKEYFSGRQVLLTCGLRLGGKAEPWAKACGALAEALAKLGARTEVDAKLDAQSFATPTARQKGDAGATHIHLLADGRVSTRKDPDDQSKAYRFEGTVTSHVRGTDSPIDDAYQALTGWNPVSDAMATDILAITASRRLIERIGQSWQ